MKTEQSHLSPGPNNSPSLLNEQNGRKGQGRASVGGRTLETCGLMRNLGWVEGGVAVVVFHALPKEGFRSL